MPHSFTQFLRAGHAPTLFAAFLYFTFSCCIWVLNGAMAPFIGETYHLSAAQMGLMLSVLIIAGALMRFPLGVLAQYIGRKNATLVEMGLIALALLFGFVFVDSYNSLLAMGVLLGIAGASFGVALSLGSGWFPPQHKGLAMGLVGAGNVGTALSVLVAPPLAQWLGWQAVYGVAAAAIALPMLVMILLAKEPPDVDPHASLRSHTACLFERDGWAFSLIYSVTFGGFIGLATFLPTYDHDQFGVSKVQAGQLTMLAAFMGAAVRVAGGWLSDRWGGVNTLTVVLVAVALCLSLVGLASFLPTYFHDQFKVTKIEAGQLTMLATLMGSAVRVVGGWIADRVGGIHTLSAVLLLVAVALAACGLAGQSLALTTLLFMLCFAALGAGNGALFQLVPLRWPLSTAVAGSMIGEVGALGGGFLPNAMGLSKQYSGSYLWGFLSFTLLALVMLVVLRVVQIRWTRTWAEKGGRARLPGAAVRAGLPKAPARRRVS